MDLEIRLQFALVKSTLEVYESFVQKAIFNGNYPLVFKILEKIVIPDRILYWSALSDKKDINYMNKILEKKRSFDIFIDQLNEIFQKEGLSSVSLDILRQTVSHHYPSINSYNRYFLEKLLVSGDSMLVEDRHNEQFTTSNIVQNYRDIDFLIDKAVCEAIYFTQYDFLTVLLRTMDKNRLTYKLDVKSNDTHKQLLIWLQDNITKGKAGQNVGWREGPDSGKWPSRNLDDYLRTLNIVNKHLL